MPDLDRCRGAQNVFVGETLQQLLWVNKFSQKLEWTTALLPTLAPCGTIEQRNASAQRALGDRKDDPGGIIWEMMQYRKRLEDKPFHEFVKQRLEALKAQNEPIPPELEALVSNVGDFEMFVQGLRGMDTALVRASLQYLRALEPEYENDSVQRPSHALAIVSKLPSGELAGPSTEVRNWLRALLTASTLDGVSDEDAKGTLDQAVADRMRRCTLLLGQCDVVLGLGFGQEETDRGEGLVATAKLYFVRSKKTREVKSALIPKTCAKKDSCSADELDRARSAHMLIARQLLADLARQYAVLSGFQNFGELGSIHLAPAPDPRVTLNTTGKLDAAQAAQYARERTFRCTPGCSAPFRAGLSGRWQESRGVPICSASGPVVLTLKEEGADCTVQLGSPATYAIIAKVEDPSLTEAAGRVAALTLESAQAGWSAMLSGPAPEPERGDMPPKQEKVLDREPLQKPAPTLTNVGAGWCWVSPALPWWVETKSPTARNLMILDGIVVTTAIIAGSLTLLVRDQAENDHSRRSLANVGYTTTVAATGLALGARAAALGVRLFWY